MMATNGLVTSLCVCVCDVCDVECCLLQTEFDSGVAQLTTHRVLWDDEEQEVYESNNTAPSLDHSLPPSLSPSLPPSLDHSLPLSLSPSLPPSLPLSLPPSITLSLSLPPYLVSFVW